MNQLQVQANSGIYVQNTLVSPSSSEDKIICSLTSIEIDPTELYEQHIVRVYLQTHSREAMLFICLARARCDQALLGLQERQSMTRAHETTFTNRGRDPFYIII